jgi:hypothetical protein
MIDIKHKDIIQHFAKKHNYKTYLEIGCENNETFNYVSCPFKIGVDPNSGGNIRLTSDEFFKYNTQRFDLIFIDGLHYYDQVSLDLKNSLRFLNDNGTILIHDMLPNNEIEQIVPLTPFMRGPWTGDVWKLGFDLIKRSDITFKIYKEDYGVGVVRKGFQEPVLMEKSIKTWSEFLLNKSKLPIFSFADELKVHSS